ncbi:hypothetical protein F2Q70_00037232 [Brassica cretica]|uniref:Uncharacterized protein n=1 Tax=Brassica cretica TaxID=69181 RepID=A0A8S9K099_BRACR|nr:hypothetical protein F2Q70_00037232 [Brassica cretica]
MAVFLISSISAERPRDDPEEFIDSQTSSPILRRERTLTPIDDEPEAKFTAQRALKRKLKSPNKKGKKHRHVSGECDCAGKQSQDSIRDLFLKTRGNGEGQLPAESLYLLQTARESHDEAPAFSSPGRQPKFTNQMSTGLKGTGPYIGSE